MLSRRVETTAMASASNYDPTKAASDNSCVYECAAPADQPASNEQCLVYDHQRSRWEADPPQSEAEFWAQLLWLEAKGWLLSGASDSTIRVWRVRTDTA